MGQKTNTSRDIWRKIIRVLIVIVAIVCEIGCVLVSLALTAISQNTDFGETMTATGILFLILTSIVVTVAVLLYKLVGVLLKPSQPSNEVENNT